MHNRKNIYQNEAGADGAAAGGGTAGTNTNVNTASLTRPDYIPETFWDGTKGVVKMEEFGKTYTTIQQELTELKGKQPQVPEKYDLKPPEGAVLKPDAIERTAATAKALGLSQEGAQKALEFANGEVKAFSDNLVVEHKARVEKWATDSKTDKDIAGEKGDQFEANTDLARRAFKKFGGDEFTKLLEETGYGNHPQVVKVFMNIGKAMASDTIETGNQGGSDGKRSAVDILYGGSSNAA